jgi:hypothetical protein
MVPRNHGLRLHPVSGAGIGDGGGKVRHSKGKVETTTHRSPVPSLDPPTRLLFLSSASGNTAH